MSKSKVIPLHGALAGSALFLAWFALAFFLQATAFAQNSQHLYEEYARKVSQQSRDDPLIGIWSASLCERRVVLAITRASDRPNTFEAVIVNGKEFGYGNKDGDPWFHVSPVVTRGVYEGEALYRGKRKHWYPTRIVMAGDDAFTAYDNVSNSACETTNTYVRREPRAKQTPSEATRFGSGFLLWQTAFIITCNHVIEGASKMTVHFASGRSYEALVAARDANNDIAVISLIGFNPGQEGFRMSLQPTIAAGDQVHAIGYPLADSLSRQPSIVSGQVSSTSGIEDSPTEFRMTIPINPGNSGGPVLNEHGEVVGIAVSAIRGRSVEGIAFGIKLTTALPLLQQVGVRFDRTDNKSSQSASQLFSLYSKDVVIIEVK